MNEARRSRSLPRWIRWLHTYVSLAGFGALLFFSLTGITLNHAAWFEGAEVTREVEGEVATQLIGREGAAVDRLGLVEELRNRFDVRGAVHDLRVDDVEISVTFKQPGYAADALIDRETAALTLFETQRGAMAIANDLHKGRHSGMAWSWLIDVSSAVLTISALTGIWLLLYLKKLRLRGLAVATVGTLALFATYFLFVA